MWKTYLSVEKILYLVITVTGVSVNIVAIVILSRGKCGLSTCTTRYLVAVATADFLVIVTEVLFLRMKFHYFSRSFWDITSVCSAVFALSRAATDCSVWFTVALTFDRFVAICCQKLKTKHCTGKTAVVVLATLGALLCLKNVPFYFIFEPLEIRGNVPWFCHVKLSIYMEPGWVGFDWFDTVLTPFLPFALILLFNALTVRHILVTSRVRKALRCQSNGDRRSDPELESRRRSVVLLFTLSGSFILLWLTNVLQFIYYQVTRSGGRTNESQRVFNFVGYLLRNASCCTNTFIYAATQSEFRKQFMSAMKRSVTAVFQLSNEPAA